MYASKRSVNVDTQKVLNRKEQTKKHQTKHFGEQKTYVQITPDGKHIQHYKNQ